MALTRIRKRGIRADAVNEHVSFTNIVDIGTEGTKVATGTTAQRGSTTGQVRFNSTTGLAEYYDGNAFKEIDSPPVITSIDDGDIDSGAGGNQTIVITGSNFSTNPTVLLVANSGSDITPSTVTRNSATQITIVHAKNGFVNANEPYDVKITNVSGLSATLADIITVDNAPVWQTSAGALTGSPFNDDGTAVSVTLSATDVDSDTVTYAVQSGALPSGITLNTSSGVISGNTPDESSDVTYNFTIRATANSKTTDRAFSMQVLDNSPPVWTTAAGSLGSVFDSARGTTTFTVVASDADGDTITYSVQSGSLPAGSSLNTSTGVISGFDAVGSDTTSTFTLRASATGGTVDREFTITVYELVLTAFTSVGTSTWSVPVSIQGAPARILVVAGGAGGGRAGGGGAGGVIEHTSFTLGTSHSVTVGGGGTGWTSDSNNSSHQKGGDSYFGSLQAMGGGGGGYSTSNGFSGGSGGGHGFNGSYSGGSSTQTSNNGGTGYGNAGASGSSGGANSGGGGGGAGAVGNSASSWTGGAGREFTEFPNHGTNSSNGTSGTRGYFAGGGGGDGHGSTRFAGGVGGGAAGSGRNGGSNCVGQANTGGGGGGGHFGGGSSNNLKGGSGIVIVKV